MGQDWEAPAQVWAQWQAVCAGFYLVNGGIFSLIYSWSTLDFVQRALPVLYKPVSIPGIISLFFGIFLILLEWPLPSLKPMSKSLGFIPKAIFYFIMGVLAFQQLTTVIAAQFLVLCSITLIVASFQEEPAPLGGAGFK